MVLANPPFGKKQNLLFVNDEGDLEKDDQVILRDDFWTSTSNKQLNFVQHILHAAEDQRAGGGGGAGQRAFRGWRGREGPAQPAPEMQRPHPAAPADRHLVFTRCEGQCDLLREAGRPRQGLDRQAVGL